MLQRGGQVGFSQEPCSARRVIGVVLLDFLQGNFAIEFFVAGYEDLTQSSPRMRSKNAETGLR
jgi:hypothetical protein